MSTERRLSKDGQVERINYGGLLLDEENKANGKIDSISNAFDVSSQDTGQSMYDSTLVGEEPSTWDSDEPTQTERQTLRKVC